MPSGQIEEAMMLKKHMKKHMKKESVNHPSHYGGDVTYEVIKVINAWGLNFNVGNAIKYLARAGKKNPDKTIEDLKKAQFYIADEIKQLEGKGTRE